MNRRVDFGATLTPERKKAAPAMMPEPKAPEPMAKVEAPSATEPAVTEVAKIAPEQCSGEFSRLFLSDAIRFVGSSHDLTDEQAGYLDSLAGLMSICPDTKLSINGHTDRRGNQTFNQKLSEDRASAVRDALIDRGIAEGRLAAQGYAGERPVLPANTPEAYALNRRVDFGVTQQMKK